MIERAIRDGEAAFELELRFQAAAEILGAHHAERRRRHPGVGHRELVARVASGRRVERLVRIEQGGVEIA